MIIAPLEAGAESETIRGDYQNVLAVPPGTNPPANDSASAAFFSGHRDEYAIPDSANAPKVPSDGNTIFLSQSAFGQSFSRDVPQPDFEKNALDTTAGMLYEGENAAFAYKNNMYATDGENYVKAQFETIGDYWNESANARASDAEKIIRD